LSVQSVKIIMRFGGCYRQDLLMKLLHNFIDAQNVVTHGEIIPNNPSTYF
jgi:hypothetical protein